VFEGGLLPPRTENTVFGLEVEDLRQSIRGQRFNSIDEAGQAAGVHIPLMSTGHSD
jgi:hypothetical protein